MWAKEIKRVLEYQQIRIRVYIYIYCLNAKCPLLDLLMDLWQLEHLGTPMYGYIFLAFENPKIPQFTINATSIINMEEESESQKHLPRALNVVLLYCSFILRSSQRFTLSNGATTNNNYKTRLNPMLQTSIKILL